MAILKLLSHRVTIRFLLLLIGACGLASSTKDLSGLETLLCAVFSCTD